jgi:phosphate transport system permease protein
MSDGLMVLFQPVHTMTGIIAQELGEAEQGGIEWHALFMVGLLLFVISLFINYLAQQVVRKFKISIG